MLDQLLGTVDDLVILGFGKGDKVRVAVPLKGEFAKSVYGEVRGRVDADFEGVSAFRDTICFEYNDETGEINGSSTFYGILVNQVLSEKGLWLPTVVEGKKLDEKRKLTREVYRNYGIAVYSKGEPNSKVAKRMIEGVKERGWELPILAPFKALGVKKDEDILDVDVTIDNDCGIMTGEEARKYFDGQFNNERNERNSGVCGVYCNRYGSWIADERWFCYTNSLGRMDFVCFEATTKNLEGVYKGVLERQYDVKMLRPREKIRELGVQKDKDYQCFLESLGK